MVEAKPITDEEELDDLEGRRGGSTQESRSTNHNTQRRTRQLLDDPPPPGQPPRNRTPIPRSRPATAKPIADRKTLDDPEGKREDDTKESHSTSRSVQKN